MTEQQNFFEQAVDLDDNYGRVIVSTEDADEPTNGCVAHLITDTQDGDLDVILTSLEQVAALRDALSAVLELNKINN